MIHLPSGLELINDFNIGHLYVLEGLGKEDYFVLPNQCEDCPYFTFEIKSLNSKKYFNFIFIQSRNSSYAYCTLLEELDRIQQNIV